jgi:hypothetical protein
MEVSVLCSPVCSELDTCTYSCISVVRLPRVDGMEPVRLLLPSCLREPTGCTSSQLCIVPSNTVRFHKTYKDCKKAMLPMLEGMEPVRWLLARFLHAQINHGCLSVEHGGGALNTCTHSAIAENA